MKHEVTLENHEALTAERALPARTASHTRADLIAYVDKARADYEAAENKWRLAQEALKDFEARSAGITVGDIVEHEGHHYRVTDFQVWQFSHIPGAEPSIMLYGNPQLKNGEYGKARRYVGLRWTKVQP